MLQKTSGQFVLHFCAGSQERQFSRRSGKNPSAVQRKCSGWIVNHSDEAADSTAGT